ncbi:hypothetical protein K461DRAFT_223843 [Myriangium duriaei CBS 260.36]|uniref:Protein N-terminal and lysine N-methyltransferase EFM7 n=1 Tax=Myriangium duriaei CBS 260.36 TaxID=1168546 RepID=A0A9P4J8C0_9PEZI|nr:hypothetical protein K461DRAFT_223843 [Myriangium duriaei CBS 260.36]
MSDSEDGDAVAADMFNEPDDFYEKPKPATSQTHQFLDGRELPLRLVGQSPLWGHYLWNAGKTVSAYMEKNADSLVRGKTVLELGAAAGLPSLTAALNGATTVVVTDYQDSDLIENLSINVRACKELQPDADIHAYGLTWGADTSRVMSHVSGRDPPGFDLLILADLLFNHFAHEDLARTVTETMRRSKDARALVFFTPYRPWLLEKDLAFFEVAKERGLHVTKIMETVMDKVMFENDRGDELLRRTVFCYEMTWC